MNKTEVTAKISEKTGYSLEVCTAVMDALESVSGSVVASRIKGVPLQESAAVGEIAAASGQGEPVCREILAAFEEVFGQALSDKFSFFKKK